jgi:hypothetical protein
VHPHNLELFNFKKELYMKTVGMLKKTCIATVATVFMAVSIQAPVMAAMVGNHQLATQTQLQLQRDDVRTFLARDDVRESLLGYGVSLADVDTRINNLTEQELLQIQERLAQLPAGGSGILEAVLIVILIFIMLDLLGATDVFPRV